GWPQARAAFAAQLTVRLAAAAGATVFPDPERPSVPAPAPPSTTQPEGRSAAQPMALPGAGPVAEAARYAGADAVRFVLARMPPGGSVGGPAPAAPVIARQVLANPAYAVRYAHAAAAAVLRWAAALGTRPAGFTPRLLAEPGELALLDALSWLPERVAMAARRERPDEFAGYLEELAARTIETMSTTSFTTISSISSERLWLADAARTGLAVGLGLLEIGAPGRL
ncbi:MAG: DALR anticodon-binding domain-containing protein, partial [Streptosporangiaceae bacterium]